MRSLLFVPADSERKLAKAEGSGADALILDLEDAVAPDNKEAARQTAIDYLKSYTGGQMIIVRINALDTDLWQDDLAAIVPMAPGAIMVPKTQSGEDITWACTQIGDLETKSGLPVGAIKLCNVATETAASLFTLGTYQNASPRLFAMTWGAEDLATDLGATANRDETGAYTGPYQLARTLCLAGAAAAGAAPIDGIYKDFRDTDGLEKEARAAMRDGFTAKMAIHPGQIESINRVFTPTQADIDTANAIIEAFRAAGNPGTVALDGVMLDRPHLRQAERTLARAGAKVKRS